MKNAKKLILVEKNNKDDDATESELIENFKSSSKIKYKQKLLKKMRDILNDKNLTDDEKLKLYNMVAYQNIANESNLRKEKEEKSNRIMEKFSNFINKSEKKEDHEFENLIKLKDKNFTTSTPKSNRTDSSDESSDDYLTNDEHDNQTLRSKSDEESLYTSICSQNSPSGQHSSISDSKNKANDVRKNRKALRNLNPRQKDRVNYSKMGGSFIKKWSFLNA